MLNWSGNVNSACSLCDAPLETRNHLFFECNYSAVVWENLACGVMGDDYTNSWQDIVVQISTGRKSIKFFVLKYIFQSTIH